MYDESDFDDEYESDVESDVESDDIIDSDVIKHANLKGYKIGPVYHGTNAPKFNKFKTGIKTARVILFTSFEFENGGFFFTEKKNEAKQYGKNIIPCFLKLSNQLPTFDQIPKNINNANKHALNILPDLNYIFDPIIERAEGEDGSDCVDLFITKKCVSSWQKEDGMNILQFLGSYGKYDWSVFDNVDVCKRISERGYDYARCWEDSGDDSYFVTNPSSIKLTDTVTYDDNNNPIPLEKRFDVNNDDIRY